MSRIRRGSPPSRRGEHPNGLRALHLRDVDSLPIVIDGEVNRFAHLRAQPFDARRGKFATEQRRHRRAPIGDDPRRLLGKPGIAWRTPDHLSEPGQRRFRVAQ